MHNQSKIGSLLISVFFVFAGIITLWDSQKYTDVDSQVFPQTVAIVLIICATIAFIMTFIRSDESEGFGDGTWWRRVLLILSLLAACAAMPYIGFLLSGIVSFIGGLIAAMHNKWTTKSALIYGLSGLVIMSAFYTLFRFVLLVPLP